MLKAALAESTEPPDAEISQAFEENQVVMYVQANFDYSIVSTRTHYLPVISTEVHRKNGLKF